MTKIDDLVDKITNKQFEVDMLAIKRKILHLSDKEFRGKPIAYLDTEDIVDLIEILKEWGFTFKIIKDESALDVRLNKDNMCCEIKMNYPEVKALYNDRELGEIYEIDRIMNTLSYQQEEIKDWKVDFVEL